MTQIRAERWTSYDDDSLKLTAEQREEMEALTYVYPNLLARQDGQAVQLRLTDVDVKKHRSKVTIAITLDEGYPTAMPVIALHSASIPRELLNKVRQEVMEQWVPGEPAAHALITETEQKLHDFEQVEVASHFVICAACNMRAMRKTEPKHPQPAPPSQDCCFTCSSTNVIPLRTAKPNREGKQCDFCFCEESILIHLPCEEQVCIDCFQRWADVDIGSRKLKRGPRSDCWSIACPTHLDKPLEEVSLLKLAAPRTYNQYARFAFEKGIELANAVTCPLPGCTNYPFLPGSRHNFLCCPHCCRWFCKKCSAAPNGCACARLGSHSDLPPPWAGERFPGGDDAAEAAAALVAKARGAPNGAMEIRVNHNAEHLDFSVSKDTPVWYLMRLCAPLLYHEVEYQAGFVMGPWGADDYEVPLHSFLLLWSGVPLKPTNTLDDLYSGSQLHAVVYYPPVRRYLTALEDEAELWNFRRNIADGRGEAAVGHKPKRGDWVGKSCPFCDKKVVHYAFHGCHHIGFAGGGCCERHWCYVCRKEHPCGRCAAFCDPDRKCGCPLCPDCHPGEPCPSCTGCPRCQEGEALSLFD
ncbi:hypothetical protein DIPPA_15676 [Diplonema papillatum]|nr:hypothetical protein DIPPA_15676 [Diplonema papillatum]